MNESRLHVHVQQHGHAGERVQVAAVHHHVHHVLALDHSMLDQSGDVVVVALLVDEAALEPGERLGRFVEVVHDEQVLRRRNRVNWGVCEE